jgi:hypothetical protein
VQGAQFNEEASRSGVLSSGKAESAVKGVGDSAYRAVRVHGYVGTRERFIKLGGGKGSFPQPAGYHAQLFVYNILWALKRKSDREIEGSSWRPSSKGKEIGCIGGKCDSRCKLNRSVIAIA